MKGKAHSGLVFVTYNVTSGGVNTAKFPPQATIPAELALALFDAAAVAARTAARAGKLKFAPRARRGATVRPGSATPLWNEVMKLAQPLLGKRGEKAKLARLLGVPRQRVHEYLKSKSACPDGERTLLLLCWVAAQRQGREIAA